VWNSSFDRTLVIMHYRIYSNARQGFFSLNLALKCVRTFLNSHMKRRTGPCQTGSLWIGLCGVKPRHASPNLRYSELLRSVEWYFLTDISVQRIGPIYKGQEIQKREQRMTDVNWHSLIFLKNRDILIAVSVAIFTQRST